MNLSLIAGLVGLALALASGKAHAGAGSKPNRTADRRELERLLAIVEDEGILPGVTPFLLAVARAESRFNRKAANTSPGEARSAARGFDRGLTRGYWKGSPWVADRQRWVFGSGGPFGFLPSTGMSQGGLRGPWQHRDPHAIFELPDSLAMAIELIHGLSVQFGATKLGPAMPAEHQNWLSIRRGWAGIDLVKDYRETHPRSRAIRERFVAAIQGALGVTLEEATALAETRVVRGRRLDPAEVLRLLGGP